MNFQQTIIIRRSPQVVFAFRCTPENWRVWRRGVVMTSTATSSPLCVGAHWVEQRRGAHGAVEEWDFQVTACETDRMLAIHGCCGEAQMEERHQFISEGATTRYTLTVEMDGMSTPPSLAQKHVVDGLLHLKWALEAPAAQTA